MAKIKRVICFFNPSIPKDEALTKIWKQEEAIFKVTVFEGELQKVYGNPLWDKIRQVEDTILRMYKEFTPYWAVFENNGFRKSSY
jgi:hypothetical protein